MKKIYVSILLGVIFVCVQPLYSCSCFGTESLISSVINNDVIFIGKVFSKQKVLKPFRPYIPRLRAFTKAKLTSHKDNYMYIGLEVVKLYKGIRGTDTIYVKTGFGSGDCGFPFQEGETYIVYARYEDEKKVGKMSIGIETNTCLRTKEFDTEEVEQIEKVLYEQRK